MTTDPKDYESTLLLFEMRRLLEGLGEEKPGELAKLPPDMWRRLGEIFEELDPGIQSIRKYWEDMASRYDDRDDR